MPLSQLNSEQYQDNQFSVISRTNTFILAENLSKMCKQQYFGWVKNWTKQL